MASLAFRRLLMVRFAKKARAHSRQPTAAGGSTSTGGQEEGSAMGSTLSISKTVPQSRWRMALSKVVVGGPSEHQIEGSSPALNTFSDNSPKVVDTLKQNRDSKTLISPPSAPALHLSSRVSSSPSYTSEQPSASSTAADQRNSEGLRPNLARCKFSTIDDDAGSSVFTDSPGSTRARTASHASRSGQDYKQSSTGTKAAITTPTGNNDSSMAADCNRSVCDEGETQPNSGQDRTSCVLELSHDSADV